MRLSSLFGLADQGEDHPVNTSGSAVPCQRSRLLPLPAVLGLRETDEASFPGGEQDSLTLIVLDFLQYFLGLDGRQQGLSLDS